MLSVLLAAAPSVAPPETEGRYVVRYDPAEPRVVRVQADLPAAGRHLTIGEGRPHPRERHFRDHVEELVARTTGGDPVELEERGRDGWRLLGPARERVHVAYALRVEHDGVPWDPSHAEVAYAREDGVFLRGWSLFVLSDDVDRIRVRFEAEADTHVACTLDPDPEGGSERAGSRGDAGQCGVFLGSPQVEHLDVGGVSIELVVTHDLDDAHAVMREPLATALAAANEYFGRPATGRYVVFASRSPVATSSGSGFRNGMSMLFELHPRDEPGGTWLHTLVHELVHTWNGVALERAGPAEEWFNEGFTNYVAVHLAATQGLSDPAWRRRYLAEQWTAYVEAPGGTSMIAGGSNKGQHAALLYGGGMIAAAVLDLWIREDSEDQRTLADVFRSLLSTHGSAGRRFTTADVQRAVQGLLARDAGPFFERHVRGAERIDAATFLVPLGLALDPAADDAPPELRPDPEAPPEARARGRQLLGIE